MRDDARAMGLLAVGGTLLALAANVYAGEPGPLDWLTITAIAGHQTNYTGVFVYQYDNFVETTKITHIAGSKGEFEKLDRLDGPKREIIRHDGVVWSYDNHKLVQLDSHQGRSRFPSLLPEQLTALGENYQARLLDVERVAGYNAQVILFQPKDNLRYSHKIWVDADSGLLLKAAVLGDKNRVAELYAFTQLQIGGDIDNSWVEECDTVHMHGIKASPEAPEVAKEVTPIVSGWVADNIPSGFKKTMEIRRAMHGKHAPVIQLMYSDGLSAISIFIEPDDQDEDDVDGLSSRGSVSLYHKVLDNNLVTVVGEVPPLTVMQVLDSVRYNGK
jgi:sigma-E factor negative regulatory protein RseB